MQPKPITELDRLVFVIGKISDRAVFPRGWAKIVPNGNVMQNEAFRGLNRDDCFSLKNWQFMRVPQSDEIRGKRDRGEAVYDENCFDAVSHDTVQNSWSVQKDVTGTVATLRNNQWPGFMAYHRCNTDICGSVYLGDGICNHDLAFMV